MDGKEKEGKMSRESAGVSWLLEGSRTVLRLGGDLRVEKIAMSSRIKAKQTLPLIFLNHRKLSKLFTWGLIYSNRVRCLQGEDTSIGA